jgi:predicted enzyme related to lactoylglutathione lyase
MTSFVRNISFDGSDAYALAEFWSAVIGHPIGAEFKHGDPEVVIEPPDGPRFYFQTVPEGKIAKNRMHICLQPADAGRDAEVYRLVALGASMAGDHRDEDGDGWVVLRDPAGNEFCVTRSEAERHE